MAKQIDILAFVQLLRATVLPAAVREFNEVVAPARFSKRPRAEEPLPLGRRQLSSYRTRLGTMLEYSLSSLIHRGLRSAGFDDHRLTFVSAHQYPDFIWRSADNRRIFRFEMKAVDAESDEHAARFDAPTNLIAPDQDVLLLLAWKWHSETKGEYPVIFSTCCIAATELAHERDLRLVKTGGRIDGDTVLVPSSRIIGKMVPDPGNYGKLWRIIPKERIAKGQLSPGAQEFVRFLRELDASATRKRFRPAEHPS